MRHPILIAAFSALLTAGAAQGDPTLQLNGVAVKPGVSPTQLVAATDQLMSSAIGKQAPGRLMLLANVADGDNPASHTFAILNKSAAEGEAFNQKLIADPAFAQFTGAVGNIASITNTARYRTIRSWGDFSDADAVWFGVALIVNDSAAFLAAQDRYWASSTAKKFPGQGHLSAVVAAGASPVTHIVSVGFASEAELDSWQATNRTSPDWQAFMSANEGNVQVAGFVLNRLVKAWGSASLADLAAD